MARPNLTEDRLFVVEELLDGILRRMTAKDRDEVLSALVTTCEGSEGTLLLAEHLQRGFEEKEEHPADTAGELLRFAEMKNRIYGEPE